MTMLSGVLDKIRMKIDIAELIREYLPNLRKSGRNFKTLCPFHHEKTASFMVSSEKGLFHCFGCGVGGDIFGFLMRIENITFFEAVRKLARRCGVEIKDGISLRENVALSEEKKLALKICEEAATFYHQCLRESKEGSIARDYLIKRNVSEEIVEKFCLGYAPGWGNVLKETFEKKGYSLVQLQKLGLVSFSEQSERYYDYFRNRVIFPITDYQGRVVAFGGRTLDDETVEGPKYLNSPETLLFSKGRVLYGLAQASKSIHSQNEAIVLEGYFDVLALYQAGIENAVAPLGTALTAEQVHLLRRYTENVLLIFDADSAGMSAALRSGDLLLEKGIEVKMVALPEGKDVDEIIQTEGKGSLMSFLQQACNIVEFQIGIATRKYGSTSFENKLAIVKEVLPTIIKIKNALVVKELLHRLAERFNLDEETLNIEAKRLRNKQVKEVGVVLKEKNMKIYSAEKELLSLLLQDPSSISLVVGELEPKDFLETQFVRLAEIIFDLAKEFDSFDGEIPFFSQVLNFLGEENSPWLSELVFRESAYRDKKNAVINLANTIRQRRKEEQWKILHEEIKLMLEGKTSFDENKYSEYKELTKNLKGTLTD